jgi:hypothetical protein
MSDDVASHTGIESLLADGSMWLPNLRIGPLVPPGEQVYLLVENTIKDLMANQAMFAWGKSGRE